MVQEAGYSIWEGHPTSEEYADTTTELSIFVEGQPNCIEYFPTTQIEEEQTQYPSHQYSSSPQWNGTTSLPVTNDYCLSMCECPDFIEQTDAPIWLRGFPDALCAIGDMVNQDFKVQPTPGMQQYCGIFALQISLAGIEFPVSCADVLDLLRGPYMELLAQDIYPAACIPDPLARQAIIKQLLGTDTELGIPRNFTLDILAALLKVISNVVYDSVRLRLGVITRAEMEDHHRMYDVFFHGVSKDEDQTTPCHSVWLLNSETHDESGRVSQWSGICTNHTMLTILLRDFFLDPSGALEGYLARSSSQGVTCEQSVTHDMVAEHVSLDYSSQLRNPVVPPLPQDSISEDNHAIFVSARPVDNNSVELPLRPHEPSAVASARRDLHGSKRLKFGTAGSKHRFRCNTCNKTFHKPDPLKYFSLFCPKLFLFFMLTSTPGTINVIMFHLINDHIGVSCANKDSSTRRT